MVLSSGKLWIFTVAVLSVAGRKAVNMSSIDCEQNALARNTQIWAEDSCAVRSGFLTVKRFRKHAFPCTAELGT